MIIEKWLTAYWTILYNGW